MESLTLSQQQTTYKESLRPQFHFTAKKYWLNDPNGLVYYKGEYHLFFQYNPGSLVHLPEENHWGHAVSTDLVHWKELPIALYPDEIGQNSSGSVAVDWNNDSGFNDGDEKVLVAAYTAARHYLCKYVQCLAFSNDKGRTWTKYDHNPVAPMVKGGDPRIFWYAPKKVWVMAVSCFVDDAKGIGILNSTDLKDWTFLSFLPDFWECPDIFELSVDGDPNNKKWVILGGTGDYMLGSFDGQAFTPETDKIKADYGANFYATQTYNDIPKEDGRRIQIVWMGGGKYPDMPFNQQMTFPCELTLRTFPQGVRLCRMPVKEIKSIYGKTHSWKDEAICPEKNILSGIEGDLFDISAEIDMADATEVGINVRGNAASYSLKDQKISCLGCSADLKLVDNRIKLRILVDRTSIELFANDGEVSMSSCFLPDADDRTLGLYCIGGAAKVVSLEVRELKSAWD